MSAQSICPKYEKLTKFMGKRWTGLILKILMDGNCRFSTILDSIEGLSSRLLTERLKEMEEFGVVERIVKNEYPVKVEYVLTEKGKALAPILEDMQRFADKWIEKP